MRLLTPALLAFCTALGAAEPLMNTVPQHYDLAALNLQMSNPRQPIPGLLTGGQPAPEDLHKLKQAGIKTVIDLRTAAEARGYDEAAASAQLGLRYVLIPVAGAGDLVPAKVTELREALLSAGEKDVLVHCGSGNRVGALFALKAKAEGRSSVEALELGKAAGLSGLEAQVRGLLGE